MESPENPKQKKFQTINSNKNPKSHLPESVKKAKISKQLQRLNNKGLENPKFHTYELERTQNLHLPQASKTLNSKYIAKREILRNAIDTALRHKTTLTLSTQNPKAPNKQLQKHENIEVITNLSKKD